MPPPATIIPPTGAPWPKGPALRGSSAHPHRAPGGITPRPAGATDPDKDAALIMDGSNGKVLFARNETVLRHPASLTKMMTLYLLFDALRGHRISMDTQMPVSVHASQQKPTKLSLRPGQVINVDTAIRAIVIRSANDVAVVIAEALGGNESHFAEMMTAKARELGMKDTNYHNASGLPDALQITTANDLALLPVILVMISRNIFRIFRWRALTIRACITRPTTI